MLLKGDPSMSTRSLSKRIVLLGAVLVLAWAGWTGWGFATKLMTWRHLDATYTESFAAPANLAPGLVGKRVLFHMKTGLDQDDSQICVGFNIIFAALEAGADVTVLFDAGALLDLTDKSHNLSSTGVPVRLRKLIAAQMNRPLDEMPVNYKAYLDLLHERGAKVHANTAMLIVTGDAVQVAKKLPGYPYVAPAPYSQVAQLIAEADTVFVY